MPSDGVLGGETMPFCAAGVTDGEVAVLRDPCSCCTITKTNMSFKTLIC